ncbi:MAG: RIP metalloprotease RseP [Flavobacteriia bacterium]|nr:RIP metalloprotease RseP [Flavobacteriia bacterium]
MLIQLAQFLAGLSLLIVLHELGHFIPAKLFKTRVEKFYLFFDYKFSLLKKKIGGTTYGIGWIPLGGYVKISGMVDESMDTEGLSKEPEPWEFRAKPGWQRLIILTGGVIVNFILAIVIYAGMMNYYGESYLPIENIKYGLEVSESMENAGFQNGDRILSIGGEKMERFSDLKLSLLVGLDEEILIDRNGQEVTLTMTDTTIGEIIESGGHSVGLRVPFVVDTVVAGGPAAMAGLMRYDSIVAVNNESIVFFDQFRKALKGHAHDTLQVGFYRGGQYMTTMVVPDSSEKVQILADLNPAKYFNIVDTTYAGWSAVEAGWNKATRQLGFYIKQFKIIFSPKTGAAKEIGGFRTMMNQYEENNWNWERFWGVTAFISIMLGFLNILPIPALDGGHVLFTLIEMATGRKPSIRFLEIAQTIGFFLLVALLIYANLNDFNVWDVFRD